MYICMYVCMYAYTHTHIHTYTCIHACIHTYARDFLSSLVCSVACLLLYQTVVLIHVYTYTYVHTNMFTNVWHCSPSDVPLPVSMRGNVTLFDFVPCEWEITRALMREEQAEGVWKSRESPVFSLWPVGRDYVWFKGDVFKQRFGSPKAALHHLEAKINERYRFVCM